MSLAVVLSGARTSSSASNGLPPHAAWRRSSSGGASQLPVRACTSRCSEAESRGPSESSTACAGGNEPNSRARRASASPRRTVATSFGPPGSRRRSTNDSAAALGASSHCQSSIAISTVPSIPPSSDKQARPTRCGSIGACATSSHIAAASARRCGSGRTASSSTTGRKRSTSAANDPAVSLSVGRAHNTRVPAPAARVASDTSSAVLPTPASPSMNTASGRSSAPNSVRSRSSSASRPTIPSAAGDAAATTRR